LEKYPPSARNSAIRADILRLLDYPLHINNYDPKASVEELTAFNQSVQDYLRDATARVIVDLKTTKPASGVVIWKLYNMGFIIRSPKSTIAIDITNPSIFETTEVNGKKKRVNKSLLSDRELQEIAAQIDTVFVTHFHSDHFAPALNRMMLEAGKQVVLPTDKRFDPVKKEMVKFLEAKPGRVFLDTENKTPVDFAGVQVRSFPGNQGADMPCNIYHIDLDGVVIIHNGDNGDRAQESKLAWCPPANIIIASCWNGMASLVRNAANAEGYDRASPILIPAHENEMSHTVGHRESYRELFERQDRLGNRSFTFPPVFVLDCGERLAYPVIESLAAEAD